MDEEREEQWKRRVMEHLRCSRAEMTASDIGVLEPRPGKGTVTKILGSDSRFLISGLDRVSLRSANHPPIVPRRTKNSRKTDPPFHPKHTQFCPPELCWDVILANPHTATTLASWRWIWVLPQVCKAFVVNQDSWIQWMCAADRKPLIWKTKANAVLALTAKDLQDVSCHVARKTGWRRRYETHLMRRDVVLKLALEKHNGTYAGINSVFLKRAEATKRRK
jgi:hypothetical protein